MTESNDQEGPASPESALAEYPPVVYVPTVSGDDGQMHVDLKRTKDGRVALFCYSAPDRLRDWYGGEAYAVVTTTEGLARIREDSPFDLLLLDKRIVPFTDEERAASSDAS